MAQFYDVGVMGLGAYGSATIFQLSKMFKGKVIGFDQGNPPHNMGSSHGDTRISRVAIGEGAEFTPSAHRSHEIWDELYQQTGRQLLYRVGGLIMAVKNHGSMHGANDFLNTTIGAAEKFKIRHTILETDEIKARFPQFNLVGDERGYYESGAGYLLPELCIKTQLDLAQQNGAEIKTNTKVWCVTTTKSNPDVKVSTTDGEYTVKNLIVTTGPWMKNFFGTNYAHLFKVSRQVLYWFDIDSSYYESYREMPIFIWEPGSEKKFIYGFPAINGPSGGLKVATEYIIDETTPDTVNRTVSQEEINTMYETCIKDRLLGLKPNCIKTATCLYTKTPDSKFIIDYSPDSSQVIFASCCSGHGFKHSAAIGEAISELALKGKTTLDIGLFSLSRIV